MADELETLIAKRFIQRRDVYAVQFRNGEGYQPKLDQNEKRLPFKMQVLRDHVAGVETAGHYLLDSDSNVKLFCFDIDLEKQGWYVPYSSLDPWVHGTESMTNEEWDASHQPVEFSPRDDWQNRAHPSRDFLKYQMRMLGNKLAAAVTKELEIPCAVAYSGSKGIHVYGFTGTCNAAVAREGAMIALDSTQEFEVLRGKNFFRHINQEPVHGYPNFSVEVYPKQDALDNKDLGNLLRLPLGVNRKTPKSPTFFVDCTAPMNQLVPTDPIKALTDGNPWVI